MQCSSFHPVSFNQLLFSARSSTITLGNISSYFLLIPQFEGRVSRLSERSPPVGRLKLQEL